MPTIFGIDVQAELADAITPQDLPAVTLIKYANAPPVTGSLTRGVMQTPTSYVSYGNEDSYVLSNMRDAPNVQKGDKGVLVIAKPWADAGVEPQPNDHLVVDGKEYVVIAAKRDSSAKASYFVVCRG